MKHRYSAFNMASVFILGAGASHFAEYPLARELWPFIRDNCTNEVMAQRRAREVTDAMGSVLEEASDLELLFTTLDLARGGAGPAELKDLDWRDLRPKVMGMIADAFQGYHYRFQSRLRERDAPQRAVLDRWASRVRNGDTILTFNWDLLHERALWDAGKWHYADGYGFACADAPGGCRSGVKVLKLHGSVNWGQRDEQDCEPSIEYKADFFPTARDGDDIYRRAAGQWNDGRYLITPSYLKDLSSNRLLLGLWTQVFDILSAVECVTVIGFQLHPADALARQLIACALTKNDRPFRIRIVAPAGGADHWDEFCDGIGRGCERIRMKFEDWVMQAGVASTSSSLDSHG
jgi:hypothetical protein